MNVCFLSSGLVSLLLPRVKGMYAGEKNITLIRDNAITVLTQLISHVVYQSLKEVCSTAEPTNLLLVLVK